MSTASGPIEQILKHATALVTVAGVFAYFLGYLTVVYLSAALGVPLSSFALEFRDVVLISVGNVALIAVAVLAAWLMLFWAESIIKRSTYRFDWRMGDKGWIPPRISRPKDVPAFRITYMLITVVLGVIVSVAIRVQSYDDLPQGGWGLGSVVLLYACVGASTGFIVGTVKANRLWAQARARVLSNYPGPANKDEAHDKRVSRLAIPIQSRLLRLWTVSMAIVILVAALLFALWWLPQIQMNAKAESIFALQPRSVGSSVDLVIRPQVVTVVETGVSIGEAEPRTGSPLLDAAGIAPGECVVVVSESGGRAVIAHWPGTVTVLESQGLIYRSDPPEYSNACEYPPG